MFDLDWVFGRIRKYAAEQEMTPQQVEDAFMAGVFCAAVLRPEWPVSQKANGPRPTGADLDQQPADETKAA